MNIYTFKGVVFNDLISDNVYGIWSQICKSCASKIGNFSSIENCGSGICGVNGCNNKANYYFIIKDV